MSGNYNANQRGDGGSSESPLILPGQDARPVQTDAVVSREIAGETILVPIKSTAGELDDIFTLNEIATRVWNLIDGTRTVAAIAEVIASEYDVNPNQALADTRELIALFNNAEVVMFNPEPP